MLILLLSALLFQEPQPKWSTEATSVFRPLVRREVAVSPNGHVFIVDRGHSTVLAYGANGAFVRKIGSKGLGPGELTVPTWIWLAGDRLYVEDAQSRTVSVFSLDGTYQKRFILPAGNEFVKWKQGWLYGNWDTPPTAAHPTSSLFLADERLEKPGKIHSWPHPTEATSRDLQNDGNGKIVVPFNPALDKPLLVVSKDGQQAFFVPQGSDDLHIFDLANKKLVKVVKNENKPLPFNTAWGEKKLAEANANLAEPIRKLMFLKPQYPNHFPLVNDLAVLPDGTVAMKLWTAWLEKQPRHQLFDSRGKAVTSAYSDEAITRVFGEFGELAYVADYDSDEEEGKIVALPKAAVNAYVKAHPVDYHGLSGNVIITVD